MISLLLRIGVTVGIFALILRGVDFEEVLRVVATAAPSYLLIAVLLQFGSSALAAWRWGLLMDNLHFDLGVRFYLRSYFKGTFFNQGLPTSIGGDAIRVLDVAGHGFRKRDSLYAVGLDRIVGLLSLLVAPIVVGLWYKDMLPPGVLTVLLLLGVSKYDLMEVEKEGATLDARP